MIIFKQKEFSAPPGLLESASKIITLNSIGFGRELLKLIIIEDIDQDVRHWLTITVDDYVKNTRLGISKNNISKVKFPVLLSPIEDIVTLRKICNNDIFKFDCGKDYIKNCIDAIQTDTSYGRVKYNHLPEIKNLWPTEDLLISFKFIALCLTGQIDPEKLVRNGESWKYYDLAKRTKPNYNTECSSDLERIKLILAQAVRIIRENTGKSIGKILEDITYIP